jgi:hypothetical protein
MTMATFSSWNSIKKAHHVDFVASRTWQISHSFDVIIEVDDTVQVIDIEAEWQMVGHYQLLYISLTLVYEEIDDTLQIISIETNVKLIYNNW